MPIFIKPNFERNLSTEKFFSNYPSYHFFKFLNNNYLHGYFILILFKIFYWCFKIFNRLELEGKENMIIKQKNYDGKAFLIVMNHASYNDVLMNYAIWGHLGYMTHTFTLKGSFSPKYRTVPMLIHFIEMVPMIGKGSANINRLVNTIITDKIVTIYPSGTYPAGKYANSGFVQEAFSGAARIAFNYWKKTGVDLLIQPICSLGANMAYPPRRLRRWKKFSKKQKLKENKRKSRKKITKKTYLPKSSNKKKILKQQINHKIIFKFGKPFSLKFSDELTYREINEKKNEIQMKIANIWGQKRLITNYKKKWLSKSHDGKSKERKY